VGIFNHQVIANLLLTAKSAGERILKVHLPDGAPVKI